MSVFGRLNYNFDSAKFGANNELTDGQKLSLNYPSPLYTWQASDLSGSSVTNYFQNPHSANLTLMTTYTNQLLTYSNTQSVTYNSAPTEANTLYALANNLLIEISSFTDHTNRMSGVTESTNKLTIPDYQIAMSIGRQVLQICNQVDGVQNNAPILGNFTSLAVVQDVSNSVIQLSSSAATLNASLTIVDGNTYSSISQASMNTIIATTQTAFNLLNSRRVGDTTFYTNSISLIQDYNTILQFSNLGVNSSYLIKDLGTGTTKLQSYLQYSVPVGYPNNIYSGTSTTTTGTGTSTATSTEGLSVTGVVPGTYITPIVSFDAYGRAVSATSCTSPTFISSNTTTANITTANITTSSITTANITTSSITTANITTSSITTANITTANIITANATTLISNTHSSISGLHKVLFDDVNKRTLIEAYGFQFKNDNGIITPVNKTRTQIAIETASTFVVPAGVTYIFVKMWGAGGGGGAYGGWRQGSVGGGGGYTHGLVPVVPGETVTIRSGQRGYSRWGANKAYPDGGGASLSGGDNQYAGSGGGSSSILVPSISATLYCMFAGAGGGGGSVNGFALNSAGAGGGIRGQNGCYTAYNSNNHNGKGGTQTAGGDAGTGTNTTGGAGSFNQGGTHQNANNYGGGGGGGYYGGGSGAYGNGNSMGGGGGGSGYIHPNILMGVTMTGNINVPANPNDPDLYFTNNDWQYATGGEEDGYAGPGLVIIYY